MKKTILFISLALLTTVVFAQKKTTTSGVISFDATTPADALPKAENKTVIAAIDTKSGDVAFEANIKDFSFSNPKIQEHFNNDSWMDSEKYPKATFKGKITNLKSVNFSKDGTYTAEVEGELTMHGVTKPVKTKANITVSGSAINATAEFTVKLEEYNITGKAISMGKVAPEPKIMVKAEMK